MLGYSVCHVIVYNNEKDKLPKNLFKSRYLYVTRRSYTVQVTIPTVHPFYPVCVPHGTEQITYFVCKCVSIR